MKEPTRVTTHTARPSTHRCRVIGQQSWDGRKNNPDESRYNSRWQLPAIIIVN